MFTVAKVDGALVFRDCGGYQSRNASTMWCIAEADRQFAFGDFDDVEVWTGDVCDDGERLAYSHMGTGRNTVPDFNFKGWPEAGVEDYARTCEAITEAGGRRAKRAVAGWIGAASHPIRRTLKALEDPELLDVTLMEWKAPDGEAARLPASRLPASTFLSLPDLVAEYEFLVDVEGSGYSGRLKFLLWSNRPVLLVDRPHREFFSEGLEAWAHYVPVRRDLGDLTDRIRWCLSHAAEAAAIARNARAFAEANLSRDGCFRRWRAVLAPRSAKLLEAAVVVRVEATERCAIYYDAEDGVSAAVALGSAGPGKDLEVTAAPGHRFRAVWADRAAATAFRAPVRGGAVALRPP